MKAEFNLSEPDAVFATMKLTMTIGEWKQVKKAIRNDTVATNNFTALVADLIDTATESYGQTRPLVDTREFF